MDYYMISYGLTFIALIISLCASGFVKINYNKYSKVKNDKGITGAEAARILLDRHGLNNIEVVPTTGFLSDHYDPRRKIIRLSDSVYRTPSIASVAVACHECGHAIQDKENYFFLRLRNNIIPLVNFSSYAGYIAIMLGCLTGAFGLIWLGIILECIILLFQIITLPVEFDASRRALKELDKSNIFTSKEVSKGRKVLTAAALTYVASVTATLLQILRLILIYGNRRRD